MSASRLRVVAVAVFAALAWVAVVALVATEHGAERRQSFDGHAR